MIKFICNRQALDDAINIVQKAVAVHSTMPILEGILIKATDNKVILTGNDLEIGIECIIEAETEKTGSVVVNSRLFGDIIRKLSGETIYFDVNDQNVTNIKCGNSKFNISGIEANEFPEIQKLKSDFEITLSQRQLKDLIRHTIFAAGTSDAKLILTGCLIEASGKNVNMVAVDGFRLALKKIETESDAVTVAEGDVSIVIPAKTLNELSKIIDDIDQQIKIFCSEKNVRFEFDNVILTSRILEGDYIDYKRIIPTEYKTKIKVDVKTLLSAIERASLIITNEINRAPVVMNVKAGEILINCETNAGKVEELIPVEMAGEEFEIGFNNKFLLDALKAATGEYVYLNFIGSVNPCLITPTEGDNFKFIVLPVRLKS